MRAPILNGVRLGLGVAIIGTLLAETKLSNAGIGYLIMQAYSVFDMPRMYAMLIVLFSLAIGANELVGRLGRRARFETDLARLTRTNREDEHEAASRWIGAAGHALLLAASAAAASGPGHAASSPSASAATGRRRSPRSAARAGIFKKHGLNLERTYTAGARRDHAGGDLRRGRHRHRRRHEPAPCPPSPKARRSA